MSVAFIFPGQGSQSLGMLSELSGQDRLITETFAEASNALGYDLWRIVQEGPEAELNRTDVTQPAMLAADVAVWRLWQARGGARPLAMAGHSLGEYSALVCAGALAFADGIRVVAERGRLMQAAVPAGQGAMAAILGLEDAQVIELCAQTAAGEVVSAVNFNSPGQVVVAGHSTAVARAVELAKAAGAKRSVVLPVSVPSHCALMQPAAVQLREVLERTAIKAPAVPVINNVDVAAPTDPAAVRDALVRQLYSPVRWVESVQYLRSTGARTLIECGPGKVLAGLCKRIDRELEIYSIGEPSALDAALNKETAK